MFICVCVSVSLCMCVTVGVYVHYFCPIFGLLGVVGSALSPTHSLAGLFITHPSCHPFLLEMWSPAQCPVSTPWALDGNAASQALPVIRLYEWGPGNCFHKPPQETFSFGLHAVPPAGWLEPSSSQAVLPPPPPAPEERTGHLSRPAASRSRASCLVQPVLATAGLREPGAPPEVLLHSF